MKRVFVTVVVLGLLGAFGWLVYRKVMESTASVGGRPGAVAVAVEVAPVRTTAIRDVRQFTGSLLPRSQFVVAPKVPGRLENLYVNIGDRVQKDQLIAVLDSEEYTQQVEQARAEREVANASVAESNSALDVAKREFDRAQALREKKIASESELDEAEARYRAADARYKVSVAQVAQKDAGRKAAQIRLSYTRIQASWEDGDEARVIGERFVDEGAMLRANDPIVSVLDIDSLIAVINVIERDYPKVSIGQAAVATTDAHPGREFTGTIVRVAPLLKETSRQARVEIELPNQEHLLKPGMFVRVLIELARHEGATVVPASALARRNGEQGVFVANLEEKTARFVPVTPGITSGDLVEVLEPALSGSVVTLGHHLLEDGSAIILPGASPAGPQAPPAGGPGGAGGRP